MRRREYLTGLAGIGALSAAGRGVAEVEPLSLAAVGDDTHHPGPPRFAEVGDRFYDEMFVDFDYDDASGKDRDNFAPSVVGSPDQDPDNRSSSDFTWSIKSAPSDSSAGLEYAPPDNDTAQYDSGRHNVVEFAPDVPGVYELELDAPDGTHIQTIHVDPAASGDGGPPRISIDGRYDADSEAFVLESNPRTAPNAPTTVNQVTVSWLADDRDALATGDISAGEGTDSWTARIPKSALGGETCRVHAAPHDGMKQGYTDTVELDPDAEEVQYPNRPPEWIENGIMYEIFPRSFEGPPKEGEWPLQNSNANFKNMKDRVDYIDSLNVDVVWFTPVVPSESGNWKRQNYDQWDGEGNRFKYVGGGPHGYDALSYFQIAEDLGSQYSFDQYRNEPWPWEQGYDPENNLREKARENAMEEFKAFVQACHDKDIKVCFDFVINHCGRHHPMFQNTIAEGGGYRPQGWTYKGIKSQNTGSKYFDWFDRQDAPLTDSDGKTVDAAPAATGFAGLRVMPQWNYGNVAAREHLLAAADFLSGEVDLDAFRCDIAYGVPHSFWKEVRQTVRANDSEFMLLDETIPNDPDFAQNEFDLHFDTADFMKNAGHSAVKGGDPMKLYDAVAKRDDEGWPEHALITNATENHDEQRLFKIARNGSRKDPAKAQRAVWASGVVLPGVPFIYYGQERLITKYGKNRYNYDGSGNDPRGGDVGPGNYKRAYMNWDTPEEDIKDHLGFYRDVTAFYENSDILKPGADLRRAWFRSEDDVLVFGRSMETDDGTENVIVMVHFDPGKASVDLLPGAKTGDMFSGNDIGVETESEAVSVEFDTLAVVETDSLFSVGPRIAKFEEGTGDDNGPGSYEYPTGDDFTEGEFDMSEVTVHDGGDVYQFRVAVDGELNNPFGLDGGISTQFLQFYIHNPEADSGATAGRKGTNITLGRSYQYRVLANGEKGVWVEDYQGNEVATGNLKVNPVADSIVVEFPKDVLSKGIRSLYLAPLMVGYDGFGTGGVRGVKSGEPAEFKFGGAENPGMAPRVIDAVVPTDTTQSKALAYSADAKATVPFTSLATEFSKIGETSDPEGDDDGPGNYTYPPKPEGVFYDGAWDMTNVTINTSRSRVRFDITMASEIQNTWNLPRGFSHQFPQVYIHDPEAGDDVPAGTSGRKGLNANFAEPYHYRVVVNGEKEKQVENANGETITTDVNVSVDGKTISFDFPMDAVGGSPEDKKLATLMTPYDGFGVGNIRQFAKQAGEYIIGTDGQPAGNAPHVVDMIPPEGTAQAQALAYSGSAKARIPLASFGSTYVQTSAAKSISDPKGDDDGPGSYTYPKKDVFKDGVFDVTRVDVTGTTSTWEFTAHIDGPITNPWNYDAGFCVQAFHLYVQDPKAGEDVPTSVNTRKGGTSTFEEPYHYRLYVDGNNQVTENANGETISENATASADKEAGTISFTVPKADFGGADRNIENMKMSLILYGHDGFGPGGLRPVAAEAQTWRFGGADPDAISNAPLAIDLIMPEGVGDQHELLSYSADSAPVLPLVKGEFLFKGEAPQTGAPTAIASPGPTVFSGMDVTLDASNSKDPQGQEISYEWTQTGGPEVSLSGATSATPTLTAPEVESETTLEFEVTVTDSEGNASTATTAVTVRPQSENAAPIADAQIGVGYDQPIEPGTTVTINGYNSSDPNGGTLGYEWTQTGGPSVDLADPTAAETLFTAPEVSSQSTITFELTVSDGQGKTATDTVSIDIAAAETTTTTRPPTTTTTESPTTTTESTTTAGADTTTASGDGPGFGVVSGVLGTAGGVAYAARRLLSGDSTMLDVDEDVDGDDVDSEE